MSLHSKVKHYDVLVKELFELLDRTEESDEGHVFYPVEIHTYRAQDFIKLESILTGLRHTMEDFG